MNPGDSIAGRYRLVERIGEGGMGIVWRAEQIALGRAVAIKVIHHDNATPEMRQRFQREAELAARMRHRHVIDIVEYGHTDDGDQYLVMPMLEGETLATRLARHPKPSVDDVLGWMRAILSGLAAIHDQGIVHRDLKPGNVFLAVDADGVLLKLLDFGISRTAGPRARNSLTQLGTAIGTPQYMAPEQFESARDVDHRADLYSAGVILYEALCGNPPFEGADAFAIYRAVLSSEPVRLAQRRPDLPVELSDLVHRALARDPERRFSNAREMRDALDAVWSTNAGTSLPAPVVVQTRSMQSDPPIGTAKTVAMEAPLPLTKAKPRTVAMDAPARTSAVDVSEEVARASLPATAPKPRSKLPWLFGGAMVIAIGIGATAIAIQADRTDASASIEPTVEVTSPPAPEAPLAHRVAGPDRLSAIALAWARLDPALRSSIDVRIAPASGRWVMIASPETEDGRAREVASALGGGTPEPLAWEPDRGLTPHVLATRVRLNVHPDAGVFTGRREARDSSTLRVLPHGTIVVGLRGTIDGDVSGGEGEDALTYFVVAPNSSGWALSRFLEPFSSCVPARDRLAADTSTSSDMLSNDALLARTHLQIEGAREQVYVIAARDRDAARSHIGIYAAASDCEIGERHALHTIEGVFDELFFTETARSGGESLLVVSSHPNATPPADGVLDWAAYRVGEGVPVWTDQLATAASLRARDRGAVSGSRDRIIHTQREHYVLTVRRPREPRVWYTWDEFELVETDPPGGAAPADGED